MSEKSWTMSELLDRLACAISETRRLDLPERVLIELEDIEARLRARETLDDAYLQSISFDVIATRELDDTDDTHLQYLDLLGELALDLLGEHASDLIDPLEP